MSILETRNLWLGDAFHSNKLGARQFRMFHYGILLENVCNGCGIPLLGVYNYLEEPELKISTRLPDVLRGEDYIRPDEERVEIGFMAPLSLVARYNADIAIPPEKLTLKKAVDISNDLQIALNWLVNEAKEFQEGYVGLDSIHYGLITPRQSNLKAEIEVGGDKVHVGNNHALHGVVSTNIPGVYHDIPTGLYAIEKEIDDPSITMYNGLPIALAIEAPVRHIDLCRFNDPTAYEAHLEASSQPGKLVLLKPVRDYNYPSNILKRNYADYVQQSGKVAAKR